MARFRISLLFLVIATLSFAAASKNDEVDKTIVTIKGTMSKLKDDLQDAVAFQRSNFADLRSNGNNLANKINQLDVNMQANLTNVDQKLRSEIEKSRNAAEQKLACSTTEGRPCVFPFKYNGFQFSACTHFQGLEREDFIGSLWCSTANDENGVTAEKGYCDMTKCTNGLHLISKAAECSSMVNGGIEEDRARSVEHCAFLCGLDTDAGDRFIYGTNEYGWKNSRCNGRGCKCYCEEKSEKAECKLSKHSGYNLYRIDKRVVKP